MARRLNLVTGALGFTGSYVTKMLLDRGERVIATDLASAIDDDHHRMILHTIGLDLEHPNLELIPANLLEPETMEPLFAEDPTHIFHVASLYDYSAPLERLMRVNVDGTRNFLEYVKRDDSLERFVHWSTCGVFGKPYTAADGDKVNVPFDEKSPSPKNSPPHAKEPSGTHLVNEYSMSKWEQEKLIWRAHDQWDLPASVVRPAPIYGPGSAYGHGGIILAIAMGIVPAIPADSMNYITTSVHVEDIAGFGVFIADEDDGIGEDYNVVDNSIISYHEFLHYIALLTGRNMVDIPLVKLRSLHPWMVRLAKSWAWLEKQFGIPRLRVFEIQSATYISSSYWLSNRKSLDTGYEYRYPDVREGLKDTVAWFRDMGWLTDPRQAMVVSPGGTKRS